jgi:hypothetical protein
MSVGIGNVIGIDLGKQLFHLPQALELPMRPLCLPDLVRTEPYLKMKKHKAATQALSSRMKLTSLLKHNSVSENELKCGTAEDVRIPLH